MLFLFQDENLEKIPNVFDRLTGGNTNYSLPEILQSSGNNRKRSHILFDGINNKKKLLFDFSSFFFTIIFTQYLQFIIEYMESMLN